MLDGSGGGGSEKTRRVGGPWSDREGRVGWERGDRGGLRQPAL